MVSIRYKLSLAIFSSLLLISLIGVTRVLASGILVNSTADTSGSCSASGSGTCTLRDAINYADAHGGGSISFAGDYTITLTDMLPKVIASITITGTGPANTVIQSSASPNVASYRIFEIGNTGSLFLSGLTIRNGMCGGSCTTDASNGGGIYNAGTLTIDNSIISANAAYAGGGVYNTGTLNVTRSAFLDNQAGFIGGGVENWGTANLTNLTFYNNNASSGGWGGGVDNAGDLTLNNATLSNNVANNGGGLYNDGNAYLKNSIFANNTATSDCYNGGAGWVKANINNLVKTSASIINSCGTPAISADPMLGTLSLNGGTTPTLGLLSGSPAIDAGSDADCAAVDQRNLPRQQGTHCDMGAYELATVQVSADNKTISYGQTPAFTYKVTPPATTFTTQPTCGVSGPHTNVGSYPIQCANGAPTDGRLVVNYVNGLLTINKATPLVVLKVTNSPQLFNGTPRTAILAIVSASTPGTLSALKYNGLASAPTAAGTYAISATFTPASSNYKSLVGISAGKFFIQAQRALNGGFNIYPTGGMVPTGWTGLNFTAGNGKDLTIFKEGTASVKVRGGALRTLTQNISLAGAAGDPLMLNYQFKANLLPAGGVCQVQVFLLLSGVQKDVKTLACPAGSTLGWTLAQLKFNAAAAFNQVKIVISFNKTGGTAWFDALMLWK